MKKTIALILAVLSMVMCFTGCGESAKLVKEFEAFAQANPYDGGETPYHVDAVVISEYENWLKKLDEAGVTSEDTSYYDYAVLAVEYGEIAEVVMGFEAFAQANPYDCGETEYLVDAKLINEYKEWLAKFDEKEITAAETPYYTYAELIVSLEEYISVNDFVELVHKADESFQNGYDEFVKGSEAISSGKYDAASAAFLNAVNYFDRASGIAYAYDQEAEYVASYAECMDNLSTDAANFSVAVLLRSNDLLNKAKVSMMGHIATYGIYSVEAGTLVEEVAKIKLQIQEVIN